MTFYDFRNNTAADGVFATDQWAVHCHPASEDCLRSAGWNEETRVTPAYRPACGSRRYRSALLTVQ